MEQNQQIPELEDTLRRQLAAFALSGEISRVISSAGSLNAVLDTLCLGLVEMLGFERVAVFAIEPKLFVLRPLRVAGLDPVLIDSLVLPLDFLAGEYGDAIFRNQHIIVQPVPDYDSFYAKGCQGYVAFPIQGRVRISQVRQEDAGERFACAMQPSPLCWTEETRARPGQTEDDRRRACVLCPKFYTLAVLWIDLTGREMITADQVSMVLSVVAQAGMAMENFKMYDSLQESNEQLKQTYTALREVNRLIQRDLRQATGIQQRLLPSVFPKQLVDVCAHYVPHSEVGGDYYDCFSIDEERLGFVVADVSGHGVTAALVMSMFKMLLKSGCRSWSSPAEALTAINETFLRELNSDQFVTVFYGVFHLGKRTLTWSSAGHDPILIQDRCNGQVRQLRSTGLFVGVFNDIKARDVVEELPGLTRIMLYTDGVPEAKNSTGQMFTLDRLSNIMKEAGSVQGANSTCRCLVDSVLAALDRFTGDVPLKDDFTLLACDL